MLVVDTVLSVFGSQKDLVIDLAVGTHGPGIYHKVLVGLYDTLLLSCYSGCFPYDARGYA
jgi:hypothetical protein